MTEKLRIADYLSHISVAIERIQCYVEGIDELKFLDTPMIQDAVLRNMEIIGEAANNIEKRYPNYSSAHPEIDWLVIYAMRNRISHAYHKVDLEIVWRTIQHDLPSLQTYVNIMLNEASGKSDQ